MALVEHRLLSLQLSNPGKRLGRKGSRAGGAGGRWGALLPGSLASQKLDNCGAGCGHACESGGAESGVGIATAMMMIMIRSRSVDR
jgi:hypothetical protein